MNGRLRPYTCAVTNPTKSDESAANPANPADASEQESTGASASKEALAEMEVGPVPETPTSPAGASEAADLTLADLRREDGATIALVAGQAVTELPKDLYIPPEALEVFLETFEGPLDLLLYLIRRQNLDILEVSVAEITAQYMGYIELMTALQLELVGEYLVMAAMLAEIKSRMLLPRPDSIAEDEEDPRAELIRRLQQYERFKTAAENIDAMPRMDRDIAIARADRPKLVREKAEPDVDLREMLVALGQVLRKADMFQKHEVQFEPLSVRERMSNVLVRLRDTADFVGFTSLFDPREGRIGVVVTFLAILELVKEQMLDIVQNEPYAPIYVRPAVNATEEGDSDVEQTEQDVTPSNDEDSFE